MALDLGDLGFLLQILLSANRMGKMLSIVPVFRGMAHLCGTTDLPDTTIRQTGQAGAIGRTANERLKRDCG